jgi:hypothetical protein
MRSPGGYLCIDGHMGRQECDTFTCVHCNRIVVVKPKDRPEDVGGMCGGCYGLICKTCAADGGCKTIERRMEELEARYNVLRSYGLI